MKDKIFIFIVGVLIGAIVTTLVFFGYINFKSRNMEKFRNMEGKERPNVGNMIERPEGNFPRGEMPKEPIM